MYQSETEKPNKESFRILQSNRKSHGGWYKSNDLNKSHQEQRGNKGWFKFVWKAYDVDVGEIKENFTRRRTTPTVSNIVEISEVILEVQQELTVSMDRLTVNSIKCLPKNSYELYYRNAQ